MQHLKNLLMNDNRRAAAVLNCIIVIQYARGLDRSYRDFESRPAAVSTQHTHVENVPYL